MKKAFREKGFFFLIHWECLPFFLKRWQAPFRYHASRGKKVRRTLEAGGVYAVPEPEDEDYGEEDCYEAEGAAFFHLEVFGEAYGHE